MTPGDLRPDGSGPPVLPEHAPGVEPGVEVRAMARTELETRHRAASHAVTAEQVMSAPVVCVTPEASLWSSWRAMVDFGVRHLIVVSHSRVVGIVEDRELFAQWPLGPLALRRNHLGSLIHPGPSVHPETPIATVAAEMSEQQLDAIAVVDEDEELVGIVTAQDIVSAVARWPLDPARDPGLEGTLGPSDPAWAEARVAP